MNMEKREKVVKEEKYATSMIHIRHVKYYKRKEKENNKFCQ